MTLSQGAIIKAADMFKLHKFRQYNSEVFLKQRKKPKKRLENTHSEKDERNLDYSVANKRHYIIKRKLTYFTDINGTLPMYTEPIIQSYTKTDAQKCCI